MLMMDIQELILIDLDLKKFEEKIKELLNIENPFRGLLKAIIDKIVINKDRNVEIIYKFGILNNWNLFQSWK